MDQIQSVKALVQEWVLTPADASSILIKVPVKWASELKNSRFQTPVLFGTSNTIEFIIHGIDGHEIYRRAFEVEP